MGSLWSNLTDKQTPLRSVNWAYLFFGYAWYFVKSLLIANLDDEPPRPPSPTPRRRRCSDPPSERAMASVVTQESADLRLALPVERASTSPFPSPGSPFYPPPRLGAHEFASRPSSSRSLLSPRERDDTERADLANPAMTLVDGATTPTAASPVPPSAPLPPTQPSLTVSTATAGSPTTPTPGSVFQVKTPTTQITVPDPPPNSDAPVSLNAAAAALAASQASTNNRDSLTSSRPAPPSPAVSRRASAALSRHSSYARSRRQSKASSLIQSVVHEPEASSSSTATLTASTAAQPKRRSLLFKIRDFAFPPTDDRHAGKGPDAPRPNRPRRRWSTLSAASASSFGSSQDDEDEEQPEGADAWGSYRWNTLSSHFNRDAGQQQQQQGGPSQTDFERNFADQGGEEDDEDGYEDTEGGDEELLLPGMYRAIYAFEPEGTAEMKLEEEQVVHVVGRGGGVGWAVVEKEGGGHALVPESYLELIEAD